MSHDPETIEIRDLKTAEDALAFRTLNEEWITALFVLEAVDRETLGNPQKILDGGGRIFIACRGEELVGTLALIRDHADTFEVSKMAVSPALRGSGIGRRLLAHAISEARAMGAQSLFLASNSKLKNAVHLYESLGFAHVPAEQLSLPTYSRSDVFMQLRLAARKHG